MATDPSNKYVVEVSYEYSVNCRHYIEIKIDDDHDSERSAAFAAVEEMLELEHGRNLQNIDLQNVQKVEL